MAGGAALWNGLLAQAWGAEAPEQSRPDKLSWARGSAVRAIAQPPAGGPLAGVPEGEEEEGEGADGPTSADLELRQLLAEWKEEPVPDAAPSGLDPKVQRELGVQWLHEHVSPDAGAAGRQSREPTSAPLNTGDLFAGAFKAAAREEAQAKEAAQRMTEEAAKEASKEAKPQPQEGSALQGAYILPVQSGQGTAPATGAASAQGAAQKGGVPGAEAAGAKRPETDFLNLLNAWSDDGGQKFSQGFPAKPAPPAGKLAPVPAARGRARESPEESRTREMREAAEASPLLVRLRQQLAEDRIVTAPPEYRSFCQRFKVAGGNVRKLLPELRKLAVAGVSDAPRAKAAPDPLKAPVVVEARHSWKPKTWTQAFWSYEAGFEEQECFRRYPPAASDEKPRNGSVKVLIDEFAKYIGVLKEADPQCLEEHGLTYPRFFIGGWCPFASNDRAKELWMEDWRSGRQLWAPPGVKDLSHRWVKMLCQGVNMDWQIPMASLDAVQMGPAGSVVRLHVENNGAHAWYGQVQGKRAFFLFSPQDRERLYPETAWPEPCSEQRCEYSPIDVLHPNDRLYPKFKESAAQVAVLAPGEVLVIPQGWWYSSVALESCVTLQRRFWNRTNRSGISDEFRNFFSEEDLQQQRMYDMFMNHLEGCRRTIAQDDMPDEEDDPRK